MAQTWAPPNFERAGVVAGFVLSAQTQTVYDVVQVLDGYDEYGEPVYRDEEVPRQVRSLTPRLSRGVAFAQGLMWRPEEEPVAPAAPASALSHLFHNAALGLYWRAVKVPDAADDAYLGWVRCDGEGVVATCAQRVGEGEWEAARRGPSARLNDPLGDVQAFGGEPFAMTVTADGITVTIAGEYDPPAVMGAFAGVVAALEDPDGGRVIAAANAYDYDGDGTAAPGSAARRGTFKFVYPQPVEAGRNARLYLSPRAQAWTKALVWDGEAGETPNRVVALPQAAPPVVAVPPDLPVSVSCSDHPEERYLDAQNNTHTRIYPVATMGPETRARRVEWWLSLDGGATWEFPGSPAGWLGIKWLSDGTGFDIYAPLTAKTCKVKAITHGDLGANDPADAVVSESFQITGLAAVPEDGATSIRDASASYAVDYAKCPWAFYPTISWTAPTDVNYFHTRLTVKLYNQAGELSPDPRYAGDGQVAGEWVNQGAQTYTEPNGWMLPPMDEPANGYRRFRLYLWAVTRAGQKTLCKAWAGGATYGELVVTQNRKADPPGVGLQLGSDGKTELRTDGVSKMPWNGDFEQGLDRWNTVGNVQIATGAPHSGSQYVTLGEGNPAIEHQDYLPVAPGERWVYKAVVAAGGVATSSLIRLVFLLYDEAKGWAGSSWDSGMPSQGSGVWFEDLREWTVPAGVRFVRLYIASVGVEAGAWWGVDNVYFARVKTAAEVLLGAGLLPVGGAVALNTNGDVMIDPATQAPVLKQSVVDSDNLAPGSLGADLAKYAATKKPVGIYYGLPSYGDTSAPDVVFNTADGKIYRRAGGVWEKGTAPTDILAGTIGVGVAVAGTTYSNKIVEQGGGIFGCRLTLNLNGVTASIDNQYDPNYGGYAGVKVKANTSNWRTLVSYNGIAVLGPDDGRLAELSSAAHGEDRAGYLVLHDIGGVPRVQMFGEGGVIYGHALDINDVDGNLTAHIVGGGGPMSLPSEAKAQILHTTGSAWNSAGGWGGPLQLGSYSLWVDGSGRLRIKAGWPNSDTDGTVVGAQS